MADDILHALAGKRIVLTRPRTAARDFERLVSSHGGIPVIIPAISITPPRSYSDLDEAISALASFDLIVFTSANALYALAERAKAIGVSAADCLRKSRIAVVGAETGAAAASALATPAIVSVSGTAAGLAAELGDVTGQRILFPRSDIAEPTLQLALTAAGATVVAPVAYSTRPHPSVTELAEEWSSGRIDAVLFASRSAVKSVAAALGQRTPAAQKSGKPAIFCIGSTTAAAAEAAGLSVAGIATQSDQTSLLLAAARYFAEQESDERNH